MRALTWHGKQDVRVDTHPDPSIEEPTDAIIKVTSTAICGSDLHLYGGKLPVGLKDGDILGHEPMGIVEEVGTKVTHIKKGDRVVIPFNISCGHCFMCNMDLYSQCETTQNVDDAKGASLFGYSHLYGGVAGGQAEYLRVPQAHFGPVKVPEGVPDERYLYLSDVLPTAWQAVEYADTPPGGTLAVWGLGPIGLMACKIGLMKGLRVIGVDNVADRLALAKAAGAEIVDEETVEDTATAVREMTSWRGADAVIDAVGMEAHGSKFDTIMQATKIQVDKNEALRKSFGAVRRGGTVSLSGVYVGLQQNFPLGDLFDKQVQIRMGQANVKRWVPDILEVLEKDEDVLGVESFASHRVSLEEAPEWYEKFAKKEDGAFKVVLKPGT